MATSSQSAKLPKTAHVHHGVEGKIQKDAVGLPDHLASRDVLVRITHTSICGTDLHYVPHGLALGHEGVGIVEAIGDGVSTLQVGDRVGTSFLRNSCGKCKYCLSGREIWCYERDIPGEKSFMTGELTTVASLRPGQC